MHNEFKLDHNPVETIKIICCVKVKGLVNHSSVNRWLKKCLSDCKNLNGQARYERNKKVDSEVVLQSIEAYLERCWESIKRARYLPVQFGLWSCAIGKTIAELYLMYFKNIAKLLTHPGTIPKKTTKEIIDGDPFISIFGDFFPCLDTLPDLFTITHG